jgi:hypothetical protein
MPVRKDVHSLEGAQNHLIRDLNHLGSRIAVGRSEEKSMGRGLVILTPHAHYIEFVNIFNVFALFVKIT